MTTFTRRAEADATLTKLERRRRWPIINLNVSYALGAPTPPDNELQMGVSAEVPLFHLRGAYIAQQQATANLSRQRSVMALAEQRTALAAAMRVLAASQNRAEGLLTKALPAAETAARLAAEAFAEGASDMTSVLAVEQTLADSRLEAALAQADQTRARADVEYYLGQSL